MKKTVLLLLILFIVVALSAITIAKENPTLLGNAKPSDYKIGVSYDEAISQNKPFVALFYTDWCTYCKKFMPKYKNLSKIYKNDYNFVMINVENISFENVVNDYSISGFPTVYIIDPKIDNRVLLNNALYDDLGKLRTEIDRYSRIRKMIKFE